MDETIDTIQQSFENIPDEVKSYIYNDSFLHSFDTLCSSQQLPPEESRQLKGALFGYVAQVSSEQDLLETIQRISKTPQTNQFIIDWIKKEVSDKIFSITLDAYVNEDDESEELPMEAEIVAPSPTQAITMIQNRLTKPTSIAPTKRDYSISSEIPKAPKIEQMEIPHKPTGADMYREVPDK